jgi:Mn2+/Fe2+ NRAMP family transporter
MTVEGAETKLSAMKFWKIILSVGPAFFLAGYSIGTGNVVAMASAGSQYGMSMLWALFLACLFAFVLMEAYGRFSLVTGTGVLYAYKKYIQGGRIIAIVMLIGLITVEIMSLAGNIGILSDLISKWTGILFGEREWNPLWIAVAIIIIVYSLIFLGDYSYFEKLLIIFVSIMGLSFFITMFIVMPEPSEMANGLMFRIPDKINAPMVVAALVGTTLTAPTYFVRSIIMKEKKWSSNELKHGRNDAAISAIIMFLLSGAIMVSAAGTLYLVNIPVDQVITLVALLKPLLGRFALSILIIGIIGAALSAIIPIMILAPMLISDYRNKAIDYKSSFFRILCGVAVLFGLIVPVFRAKPVFAMLISQVFQIFILPECILSIMYLLNRKDIMGIHRARILMNIGLILATIFTLVMSWQAIIGLKESINTIF